MRPNAVWMGATGAALAALLSFGHGAAASPRGPAIPPGEPGDHGGSVAQAECGKPGQPACPLQAWMRANVATPLASNELEALARGLDRVAQLSPDPSWAAWPTIAATGAAAARAGNVPAARAACKGCHDAFREAYREKYRNRPIPR